MYIATRCDLYCLMMVARGLFGMAGESLVVVQSSMAEKWFTGKFLTLAMGLGNVCTLLGAALAAWLGPLVFVIKRDMGWVIFLLILACLISWIFTIFFWISENYLEAREKKKAERKDRVTKLGKNTQSVENVSLKPDGSNKSSIIEQKSETEVIFTYRHLSHLGILFWLLALLFTSISMCFF